MSTHPHTAETKNHGKDGIFRRIGSIIRRMTVMVWPDNCAICDNKLERGESTLCLKCLTDIPRIRSDSEQMVHGAPGNRVRVRSWFIYDHDDISHRLIHDIKYHDRRRLARKLGREFAMQKLADGLPVDVIVPIPLHWTKYVVRSYNQTREIALGINDVTGIPVSKNLYAAVAHDSQTNRNREERSRNVEDIFAVKNPAEFDGKHIAILDDVITTGATMHSALQSILKVSSPASVTFLSLAQTKHF